MSRRAPLLFLLLTCVIAASCLGIYALANTSPKEAAPMPEKLNVFVAADLHYIAPELTDRGEYFETMIRSSDGKVMDYIEELTDAFLAEVIEAAPDALILAGDLTFNGARESHEALAAKLRAVTDAGVRVLAMPGNHDLENANAARFHGDSFTRVESVTAAGFADIYADCGFDGALARDAASLSYVYELTDTLRVLMLDVNTADAPNAVKPETLAWIEAQLANAAADGAKVLAASHQNILEHNSLFVSGYLMGGSGDVVSLYERYGVIANLTGHLHCQHIAESGGGLCEIATSALSVSPNQYGVVTLSRDAGAYETRITDVSRRAREAGSERAELLDFAAYSRAFFLASGRNETPDAPDAAALTDFLSRLNAAYFAGRMDTVDPDDPMFARWRELGGFTPLYIDSILEDGLVDHTRVKLY